MLVFLKDNWGNIVAVIIIAGIAIAAIKNGYKKQVKQCLLYLVNKAEDQFGGGTGALKYAAVSTWIYDKLPAIARIFLSADTVDELIESAVDELQLLLADKEKALK